MTENRYKTPHALPLMPIALIGMPGAGKTSVGRRLSVLLSLEFFDIDEAIEARFGNISEIFARFGESRFRALETETLKEGVSKRKAVIATGGGIVQSEDNLALLKRCKTVYLRAAPKTLSERLAGDTTRPLLQDAVTAEERMKRLEELFAKRRARYEAAADLTLGVDEIDIETAAQILVRRIKEES